LNVLLLKVILSTA